MISIQLDKKRSQKLSRPSDRFCYVCKERCGSAQRSHKDLA
ncbi:hypothetical protein [Nostoc sp.]